MSQQNTNPYAQLFQQGGDFSKFLPQAQPFDLKSWMDSRQNDMQTLGEAMHASVQSMQDILRRSTEILSEFAQEQAKTAKDAMSGDSSPEQRLSSGAAQAQKLYERSVNNLREIVDMAQSAQSEVADILNKRVSASLSEIKSLADKAGKEKSSGSTKKAA